MERVLPFKKQALQIKNPKERLSFVKDIFLNSETKFSQIEKIFFLKDLLKNDKAYLFSCGPTLLEHGMEKLLDISKNNLAFAIKQAHDLFPDNIDLHFYNCGNYKNYSYSLNPPLVIEASTNPSGVGKNHDIRFLIKERNFNNSLSIARNIEDWTLEKQPFLRPYGPGIMYEIVFFTVQHLGIKEFITIGWDNKLVGSNPSEQHFYDIPKNKFDKKQFIHYNEVGENIKINSLIYEAKVTTEAMEPFYKWLKNNNVSLKIISSVNPAPISIPRLAI